MGVGEALLSILSAIAIMFVVFLCLYIESSI